MPGEPSGDSLKPKPQEIGRRDFLKTGVKAVLGVLAVGTVASIPPKGVTPTSVVTREAWPGVVEAKEKMLYSPKVTLIDMAPSEPKDGLLQREFLPEQKFIDRLLENMPNKDEPDTQRFVKALLDVYFTHGEDVASVMQKEWEKQGLKARGIDILLLQKALDSNSLQFLENDELDNPRLSLTIDASKVIDLLRNDSNKVINCSFQVGEVGITLKRYYLGKSIDKENALRRKYHPHEWKGPDEMFYLNVDYDKSDIDNNVFKDFNGNEVLPITKDDLERLKKHNDSLWKEEINEYNALPNEEIRSTDIPYFSIRGAYAKEYAEENLQNLFEVCRAYPDKFFVVAAGNEGEDFREALKNIGDKRPNNLLIVGEWGRRGYTEEYRDRPQFDVYGADVYVDNEKLDIKSGSSFSTPVISAYASMLFNKGLSMDEVKKRIYDVTERHTFKDKDGMEQSALVFESSKLDF